MSWIDESRSLSDLALCLLLLLVLGQFREGALRVRHELLRGAVLKLAALVEHEDPVALDDRVESMRDGKDCGAIELFADQLLDRLLSDDVDVGGGFVEHNDLVVPQDGPDDADQLALTDAEVLTLLLDLEVKTLTIVLILLLLLLFFLLLLLLVFGGV